MLKLLIAEDEPLALDHLSRLFIWKNYNIELAGTYTDGKQVIEHLKSQPVDIIIADIRMPFCDGLEVSKYCHTYCPDTDIILITAHREFQYAHTAINYGVKSLITKPFSKKDIEEALLGIIKAKISDANTINDFSLHLKYQTMFSNIFCGMPNANDDIVQIMNQLNFPCDCIKVFEIRFLDFDNFINCNWKYGEARFHNAISMIAFSKTDFLCSSMIRLENDLLTLVAIFENQLNTENYIDTFMASLKSLLGITCQIQSQEQFGTLAELAGYSVEQNSSKDSFLQNVHDYIQDNYSKDITLDDVAHTLCISKAYFCSLYKKYTNETFFTSLKKARLEKAKDYLINSSFKVSSIHELVGYKSNPYFYDAFKEYFGMTPHEFRKKYRKGNAK